MTDKTPCVLRERIEREKRVVASDEFQEALSSAAEEVGALGSYHEQRLRSGRLASALEKRFDVGWFLCDELILYRAGVLRREPENWWEAAGLCAVNERGEKSNEYTGFIRTIF
ncbi:hypothetical protein [Adlercreutzia shanghongiae]|uniref:Uncharacterized protein n=1 Tax=Adlercreutzia shanghongiae TaxID=3111773 RepID=A0ABU6IWM1_9ACTN|nr:hypothetical protein [Adlercreutzia sp. R22]MEC4294022.1 hypothetical protein [Adlercreutzia sp. R22]